MLQKFKEITTAWIIANNPSKEQKVLVNILKANILKSEQKLKRLIISIIA